MGAKTGMFGTSSCRHYCLPERVCVGVDECETLREMIVRSWCLFVSITDCHWTLIHLSIHRQIQHTYANDLLAIWIDADESTI